MSTPEPAVLSGVDLEATALDKARALARAIGESAAFRAFEAAQEALAADQDVSRRLQAFQRRQQEVQLARTWGGVDPLEEEGLEEGWRKLSLMPALRSYLHAQEDLTALLREVAGVISQEIGVDYGAACAPAGGCC